MTPITITQFKEFMEYAHSITLPEHIPDNYEDLTKVKGDEFLPILDQEIKFYSLVAVHKSLHQSIVSAIVTGFQLGRLYEQRIRELEELLKL